MSIAAATAAYEACAVATVAREIVKSDEVSAFDRAVRDLQKAIGAREDGDPWLSILRLLLRARWRIHTLPLPFDHQLHGLRDTERAVSASLPSLGASPDPALLQLLDVASRALVSVSALPSNALLSAVQDVAATGDANETCLLVLDSFAVSAVADHFADAQLPVHVLTPHELASAPVYQSLILVGATKWYPDWVFTAPRAECISVIHQQAVRDRSAVHGLIGSGKKQLNVPIRGAAASGPSAASVEIARPEVDWTAVTKTAYRGSEIENVRARPYLLAGNRSVFLEDSSQVYVVNPDGPLGEIMGRVPVAMAEPGTYLLLRDGFAAEDVVVQLANQDLGKNAGRLRERQRLWKARLRMRVRDVGFAAARDELVRRGSRRANNLGRWLSEESIKTQHWSDWAAICSYAGFSEAEARELWADMRVIHAAHVRAGQRMRDLLEERLKDVDFGLLRRNGYIRVKLDGLDAGSLGVFRVDARSPDTVEVHRSSLRVPEPVN